MAKTELAVLICGQLAGMLWQDEAGLFGFSYEPRYSGAPLSISMPVSNRSYGQDVVRPYLFGLLPDSERQRRALAKENGVSANNPVALLSCMGLDCPGAVQFCSPGTLDGALNRKGTYRILNDKDIAARLKSIRTDFDATWAGRDESWSLGGNQGKFALAWENGSWCECGGSSPTTHIFKENGLSADVCIAEMGRLAKAVPTAMSVVLDDAERADLPGAVELGTRLLPNVEKNCAATSRLL